MGSRDYSFTGGWQRFDVPKRVKEVTVTLEGGGSGEIPAGRVSGRLGVNDKQTLYILVAERGHSNGDGGFGGGGRGGSPSAYGGGGASAIRVGSRTGSIKAVAGGAGGASGDDGSGGQGGGPVGQNGFPGLTEGTVQFGNATGGTAIQGGNGGTTSLGIAFWGENATNAALATGGRGGSTPGTQTIGGGGGGGGYRAGGGGQAGLVGIAAAGGGGGGSNYAGNLINVSSSQGKGGTGNGSVTISWTEPEPANQPPSPPTEAKVAGQDATDEQATRATNQVSITAKLDDPDSGQEVRLVAQFSRNKDFTSGVRTVVSTPVKQTKRAKVTLTGLSQDTLYYARLYTRDSHGLQSTRYNSTSFWTNRRPTEPTLVLPADGASVPHSSSTVFQWTHVDPDPNSTQRMFRLRWRVASTPFLTPGPWAIREFTTSFNQYVANPNTFSANTIYEWQVQTQDQQHAWGPWSFTAAFFVTGNTLTPLPVYPMHDEAVDVTVPTEFRWRFRDPDQTDVQSKADLRWRAVDTTDWVTRIGSTLTPGAHPYWVISRGTFQPGVRYEYQIRTEDTISSDLSDWTESQTFWGTVTPGAATVERVVPEDAIPRPALGVGQLRAMIYSRGGMYFRGEVAPASSITWSRQRDDIGSATVVSNGYGDLAQQRFYGDLHTWINELVIFRDDERIWEGPITRLQWNEGNLEIEAKDVMAYVYRRIMRQGYNDAYRIINGVVQGDFTVVERATRIIQNALAPDDPNVLPYLTPFNYSDDAGESRVVEPYTKTAWEEVDDMAANAGLDYSMIGRRIILNDTHRPIGRLAELGSAAFSAPPIISEYGMQLATSYGVTNGSGIFGVANRDFSIYGLVELLSSAYGETDASGTDVLTAKARTELEKTLNEQARRNIAARYPAPTTVRVPDNSALDPSANIGVNDLVPGVWIPVRAKTGPKELSQWQKLDSVSGSQGDQGENVQVTMSPAPNGGEDPDADTGSTEDA